MDLYFRFSRMAHEIYGNYTDRQEAVLHYEDNFRWFVEAKV